MRYIDTSKITIKKILYSLLIVMIPIICVGGASFFPYILRLPLIYATAILFLASFVFSDLKIRLNFPSICFLLLVSYIGISVFFSIDSKTTINLLLIYLSCATLLFLDLPENITHKIISVIYVICIVIAFSIVISVFIKNCMNTYFWFIVNPSRSATVTAAINKELAIGSYSGFAREKAEAAYIMNVGIAISSAKYFSKSKFEKYQLFFTFVLFAALILTGKRTFFIVPIICFLVLILIAKVKSKAIKFICIALIFVFCVFIIMMFFPNMANIFNRFMDSENVETIGNRNVIWKYMFLMISKYWAFGAGFGSFNEFAYKNGLRVYNEKWEYNAHNSYIQFLGELGVVGTILLGLFIISALYITIQLIRKEERISRLELLYFSLYIQIMVAVYSVTGNPLYTKQILFVWLFSIGLVLTVRNCSTVNVKKLSVRESYNYG
ncbi:MAG: O-antigen ligase family protein [Ruminococcus sp.]